MNGLKQGWIYAKEFSTLGNTLRKQKTNNPMSPELRKQWRDVVKKRSEDPSSIELLGVIAYLLTHQYSFIKAGNYLEGIGFLNQPSIKTPIGEIGKKKYDALLTVRESAMDGIIRELKMKKYTQVTTASLVNIAGSCENPNASFTLNYYGREAHLSQSAQLQLEKIVMHLNRPVFTVNNSFREENYEDPESKNRRLSEFTLIEPERPLPNKTPAEALDAIITEQEQVMKSAIAYTLARSEYSIKDLGGNVEYLEQVLDNSFHRITYTQALQILQRTGNYSFGDDLGVKEERIILSTFDNIPTFITHYPANIKFFNMKRTPDGTQVYNFDLLMPKLGETVGGAVREEDGEIIKRQLRESRLGKYLSEKEIDPIVPFTEYFNIFSCEEPTLRGGYGIGFERFVGFLIGSNDILKTVEYRTLQPSR